MILVTDEDLFSETLLSMVLHSAPEIVIYSSSLGRSTCENPTLATGFFSQEQTRRIEVQKSK